MRWGRHKPNKLSNQAHYTTYYNMGRKRDITGAVDGGRSLNLEVKGLVLDTDIDNY